MNAIQRTLNRSISAVLLAIIQIYRSVLSPFLPNACRYNPTCSAYAMEAVRKHGPFRGTILAAKRIGRCHPWGGHGYDPVP